MPDHDTTGPIDWAEPVNWGHPVNAGLVAWWYGADGRVGNTWFDLVRRYPGVLTNGPTWAPTPRGDLAVNLDGVNDVVLAPDIAAFAPSQFTVSAWVNSTSIATEQMVASKFTGGITGWYLEVFLSKAYFAITGNTLLGGATTLASNVWYHLAATYDGATMWVYVNGVADGSKATAAGMSNAAVSLNIGRYSANNFLWWQGVLGSVGIHARALSAAEVRLLYDASLRGYPGVLRRVRRATAGPTGNRRRRVLLCGGPR